MSHYRTEFEIKRNLTKSQLKDYTKKKDNIDKLRDKLLSACKGGHLAREDGSLSNHLEDIEELILLGASVNYADTDGNTALHLACIHDEIEVVQLLLKYNPDLSIKNHGQTAVEVAVEYAAPMDIIRMLIKAEDK